jgi:SAM-dependent methyltransferase
MRDWIEFYDSAHSIYVNARHRDVHYRDIARQIAAFVPGPQAGLTSPQTGPGPQAGPGQRAGPSPYARVLDFGCGEALHAGLVAAVASELVLCDGAPSVRASLAARFGADRKIRIASPQDLAQRSERSLDLIVANSVVQYLSAAELAAMLALWRRLLVPDGTLIVADVIPPGVGVVSDVLALLRYALANRFLLAAVVGLARIAISPYRKLRAKLSIARYGESEFLRILADAGFSAERLAQNMEHNPTRMTFRAHPA